MHKRLWVILGIIVSAVVLSVVLGVMFSIGGVDVNTTNDITVDDGVKSEIIALSGIKKGKNIFSIDEAIAMENIEINRPELKVISIERKFPNKVVVYVTRRTGVFSLALDDGRFAVLDRELKVISIDGQADKSLTKLSGVPSDSVSLGQALDFKYKILLNLIKGAESCSFINERFSTFFVSMNVQDDVIDLKTNTGVVMRIPVSSNISESVVGCYSYYLDKTSVKGKSSGVICLSNIGWKWEDVE